MATYEDLLAYLLSMGAVVEEGTTLICHPDANERGFMDSCIGDDGVVWVRPDVRKLRAKVAGELCRGQHPDYIHPSQFEEIAECWQLPGTLP